MATPEPPEDDLSHLPTAGDGSHAAQPSPGDAPARRRTRIGPRQPMPEPEPEPESESLTGFQEAETAPTPAEYEAPASSEWQELFESTADLDDRFAIGTSAPTPPPEPEAAHELEQHPAPARKRTVIGPRAQASEPASWPTENETPAAETNPPANAAQAPSSSSTAKKPAASRPGKSALKGQQPAAAPEIDQQDPVEKPTATPPSDKKNAEDDQAAETDKQTPVPTPASAAPPTALRRKWEQWGGQALSVSVLVHAALILLAATAVYTQMRPQQVDFIPGGTAQGAAASQALEHHIQQKRSPWLKKALPNQKIVSTSATASIVLPDEMPELADFSATDISSNRVGGGMGLGGAGGGFGRSMGLGSQSGMVFQPFSMFGMQIRAKKMAVVLDVSQSMAPHLPRVVAEVDKVAKGSIVILFVGCGMQPPPPRGLDGEEEYSTSGTEFEKFWRLGGSTVEEARKFRIDRKAPIPGEEIYRVLSKRPQTYFIHNVGVSYAWLALLSDRLSNADGIYWFSDFQDNVEYRQLEIVRSNLLRRKQRLYLHAYMRGSSFDLLNSQLVKLTGGDTLVEGE